MWAMRAFWVVAVLVVAGCGSGGGAGPSPSPDPTHWGRALTKTTCRQWMDVMTPDQRFGVARDMIVRLKAKDTSDAFARDFEANVTTACEPRLDTVADIAAGIATLDSADFN